jgi:hypothetical protein
MRILQHFRLLLTITTNYGGDGIGLIFGPLVGFKIKYQDLSCSYLGILDDDATYMHGNVKCSDGSDGSWEAYLH